MNPWPFVIAAYALVAAGAGWLAIGGWLAMRAAERQPVSSGVER